MVESAVAKTIGELGEAGLLALVFERLGDGRPDPSPLLVGPGDDTAYISVPGPGLLATTDTMVRGQDWRDEWSTAADVGAKVVTQNLADIAAMGGVGTALLVTLVAPGSMPTAWALECLGALAQTAYQLGVSIAGGDLSSSQGEVSLSVTALGALAPGIVRPVLRSGARAGQVLAVSGPLGRSAAGLELLRAADEGRFPPPEYLDRCADWVGYHCRPTPDLTAGVAGARAGASALVDVSDGLVRDAGRIATASGVRIDLDEAGIATSTRDLEPALGRATAWDCVLHGGEEHVLVGSFGAQEVPTTWTVIGAVSSARPSVGVFLAGEPVRIGGWDHFGG
ncbi:MAG: thiamine-phosphate kinase [Ornithinimicrobium sp.]